jgi:hypothetical protein
MSHGTPKVLNPDHDRLCSQHGRGEGWIVRVHECWDCADINRVRQDERKRITDAVTSALKAVSA